MEKLSRRLIFGFAFSIFLSCGGQQHITKVAPTAYKKPGVIDLQITLLVNTGDSSCKFKLLNLSEDTVSVYPPEMLGNVGYFKLVSSDEKELKPGCAAINPGSGPELLTLYPKQPVTVDGIVTLKQLLCYMVESDLIGYVYQGIFKSNASQGRFGFSIPPTKFRDLNAYTINVKLF